MGRIRVGRSIEGYGLSPGITREQRLGVEKLMISAFAKLDGELVGTYYPLLGMEESVRQKLVDDHFLFVSGDKNFLALGQRRRSTSYYFYADGRRRQGSIFTTCP